MGWPRHESSLPLTSLVLRESRSMRLEEISLEVNSAIIERQPSVPDQAR